jgi:dTDP-glucose 4,6-dehydratase
MRRKVLGTISDLPVIVMDKKPAILIVAITGISSVNLIDLERKCKELNILIRIIPSALEIMENDLSLGDISDLKIENILGRHQIDYDNHEITNFLRAKKILITGAGGSIGSEIARQISALNVSDLFLLDLSENSLLELSLSINNDGLFNENNIILCDIRDSALLSKLVEKLKPDVVFHAAALKHLALLEKFPQEAYKTNVIATKNLVDSCLKNGVKYFVNISTDKAVEPISELGKSKFLSERIISGINEPDKKYISVRFGNVVGSNGSFLHTFRHQIQNGGPVTVTHPEVSRYFMTIKEAVYLVLQSIIVGKCGETMILDMGEPIKINEVAKKMISDSGKEIEIKYTNLRSGEKLHEVLTGQNEIVYYGTHRNIRHTKVKPINLNDITYEML